MSKFRETPAWEQLKNMSSKTFPLTAKTIPSVGEQVNRMALDEAFPQGPSR
jgi:hypothetical protein